MIKSRQDIRDDLSLQIRMNYSIIGVSCGSGLSAKQAERGGADLILALNSGRFRQMGKGSLAGFLPYHNSNDLVMEFGARELLPSIKIPVIFGLNATDPTILLEQFIIKIKTTGFSGINNYPTVGLFDGQFRQALEEEGISYDREVEAIRLAHKMDLFTVAFVFDEAQAEKMLEAGADVLCVHLGLTKGGLRGAKKVLTLEAGAKLARQIFSVSDQLRPDILKMVYGGPIYMPVDVEYIFNNTSTHGYIGGSVFDRTPSEKAIEKSTREFKTVGRYETDISLQKMLTKVSKHDYVKFVKNYIAAHYMDEISFTDLASVARVSRSHLSMLFHRETGSTFPKYLANFRIHKACSIIQRENLSLTQISSLVGYNDYAHFSKSFKAIIGYSPQDYLRSKK